MVTKKWFATIIGTAIIFASVTMASALGTMDQERLQDRLIGDECTGDECPDNTLSISAASDPPDEDPNGNGDCDAIRDPLRDGTGDNCPDICE